MKIVVIGGSGLIGKKLVTKLQERGHEAVAASPSSGVNRRIDRAMVADTAWPPAEKPLAFTCGPTAFVETVATHLGELGYELGRIKTERFGPTGG